jgi:hypothetical protein
MSAVQTLSNEHYRNNIGVSAVAFAKSPRIAPESTHSRIVTFDKHREHYRANKISANRMKREN